MSEVTRDEFDALATRVAALEGKTTAPATPVEVVPAIRKKVIDLDTPVVTVQGPTYTVSVDGTVNRSLTLKYLQIAVRGPGASDIAFRPGTRVEVGIPVSLTGSASAQAGDFTAYGAYSVDGTTWTNGPKVKFTVAGTTTGGAPTSDDALVITKPTTGEPVTDAPAESDPAEDAPVAGPRRIALVGRSKLPFNSIVFRQTPADTEKFGSRRGTPMDGFLWFTSRQNWDDLRWGYDRGYREWLEAGRLIVSTFPHAPESEGDQMNQRGANDAYREQQRSLGAYLRDKGMNVPNSVMRLNWEANGNWYKWSANRPGGAPALRQALINCITNLRAGGLTQARFDLCWNKGPNQAGSAFEFFPGPEYIDVVAIDQYDMWSPSRNDSDWEREMNKPPSIRSVAALAKKHGIQWAIDECGNTHGDSTKGGDNPFFWEAVRREIAANIDTCAWHTTYDDAGAPNTLHHEFDANPRSFDTYKRLWSPA